MSDTVGRVIIYGGRGALGSTCVALFKTNNFWVASIDLFENPEAHFSIIVDTNADSLEQEEAVQKKLNEALDGNKLDAIICVAGGWSGGNARKELVKNFHLNWKQSTVTSIISSALAAKYLKVGGILVLSGAQAALEPTPGMIGYGVAKAAVHHLVKSLGQNDSGLPADSIVTAILPVTLDTPMNRKWMASGGDCTSWTPLDFVADLLLKWTNNIERPPNGSLCQLLTKDSVTIIQTD